MAVYAVLDRLSTATGGRICSERVKKKVQKKFFFEVFRKKNAVFAKNRKIHFQRLLAPDNTLLLRYHPAGSVKNCRNHATSKKIFFQKLDFFEKSIF